MVRTLAVLALLAALLSLVPPPCFCGDAPLYRVFGYRVLRDVVPLGVFGGHVIGYREAAAGAELVAVDLYSGRVRYLGLAESLGLEVPRLRLLRSGDHAALTDGRAVVVWDRELRQVGRFAMEGLAGVSLLPGGHLVAWTRELVVALSAPGFVRARVLDVREAVLRLLSSSEPPPERVLRLAGRDPGEVVDELLSLIAEANATPVSGPELSVRYELEAGGPRVEVVAAGLVGGELWAAINVEAVVVVEARARVLLGANATELSVSRAYPAGFGALLREGPGSASVAALFRRVEAGASSTALAFVYEPERGGGRRLALVLGNGTLLSAPLYARSPVEEVLLVGGYQLVRTRGGVLVVYAGAEPLAFLPVRRLVDAGEAPGGALYLVYENEAGALELGLLDRSGRHGKYVVETALRPVGAHLDGDLLFLVAEEGGGTRIEVAAREPLASLLITFVDPLGRPLGWLSGEARVVRGRLVLEHRFSENPLVLRVPPGSVVEVSVRAGYGEGGARVEVAAPGTHEVAVPVRLAIEPGARARAAPAFRSPFARGYALVRDSELLKRVLPGAVALDAWGPLLALVEARGWSLALSRVSLYRVDGARLYTAELPAGVTEVRILYPYLAARAGRRLFVLDALSGALRGCIELEGMEGYDLDALQGYAVAWSRSRVAVLDLRRGTLTHVDPGGEVMAATAVGGTVLVYARLGGGASLLVVDPASGSLVRALPLGSAEVVSTASDGVFHAVSLRLGDGSVVTDVLSPEAGVVRVGDGPALAVATLGRAPPSPRLPEGTLFAALAVAGRGSVRVYIVGLEAELLYEAEGVEGRALALAPGYAVEVRAPPNASPVLVLRDLSGAPRVAIAASLVPGLVAATEWLLAYGGPEAVYLVPQPLDVGRYELVVRVLDDRGAPLEAEVLVEGFGAALRAEGGRLRLLLSSPGAYRVVARAPHFEEAEAEAVLGDERPSAVVVLRLRPRLYELAVSVVTPDGRPVGEGLVVVRGLERPVEEAANLSGGRAVFRVARGSYRVSFTSPLHAPAEALVEVENDTSVTLVANRTGARLLLRVVDEAGAPVAGAVVTIESPALGRALRLRTGPGGEASVVLPLGANATVVASHPGYEPARAVVAVSEELEGRPLVLRLRRPAALVTVVLVDAEGEPESGRVVVRDASGRVAAELWVDHVATLELPPGAYTFEAEAPDGRRASAAASLESGGPPTAVELVLPPRPRPLHAAAFPYLLAAAVAASAAVLAYRRFVRRPRPRAVSWGS